MAGTRRHSKATRQAEICAPEKHYGKLKVEAEIKPPAKGAICDDDTAPGLAAGFPGEDRKTRCAPMALCSDPARVQGTRKNGETMCAKDFEDAPDLAKELGLAMERTPQRSVEIDVEKYQAWLDDPDLTDDQKEQIITALWQIITAFVDLGFGVHPLQEACGKLTENEGECGGDGEDMVSCDADTLTDTFNTLAAE